jgi:hypothetical protein
MPRWSGEVLAAWAAGVPSGSGAGRLFGRMRRVETIGNQGGDDAACEEDGDNGERAEVADVDEVGGEDLDPDEGEDERDGLVEVAEAADEELDDSE